MFHQHFRLKKWGHPHDTFGLTFLRWVHMEVRVGGNGHVAGTIFSLFIDLFLMVRWDADSLQIY